MKEKDDKAEMFFVISLYVRFLANITWITHGVRGFWQNIGRGMGIVSILCYG